MPRDETFSQQLRREKRQLRKGYREGGLTETRDRTSPHYSGLDRDVRKRGLDPFGKEGYRPNKALKKRVGFAENFDDQDDVMDKEERKARQAKTGAEIAKVTHRKSFGKDEDDAPKTVKKVSATTASSGTRKPARKVVKRKTTKR